MSRIVFLLTIFLSGYCYAEMGVPVQLRLKSPSGVYPTDTGLSFRLLVLSPTTNCILREEIFSSQSITNGSISFNLSSGVRGSYDPNITLNQVYDNSKAKTGLTCVDANNNVVSSGQSYTPLAGDVRVLRVSTVIGGDTIIANFNLRATPYAIQAESVGGKAAADIVVNDATTQMNQTNLNDLLFDVTHFNNLKNFASTGQVSTTTNFTGSLVGDVSGTQGATSVDRIKGVPVSSTAPVTGNVLQYNGTQYVPVAIPSAAVSSVAGRTGAVVLSSADISGLGNSAARHVGTTAGTVAAGDDSRIVNALQSSSALSGDVTGTISSTVVSSVGGKTSGQISTSVNDTVAATASNLASTLVKRDASGNVSVNTLTSVNNSTGNLYVYDTTNSVRVRAPSGLAANYILTLPANDGTAGQILQTDGSGVLSWVSAGGGGAVIAVTASPPLVSSGGTTPNLSLANANATTTGALTSTDWNLFNSKQASGSYITTLTGDVTASGPGSSPATIANNAVTTAKINNLAVTNAKINDVAWSKVTGTPTTLSGYGITDAQSTTLTNGRIRIGNVSNLAAEQTVSGDASLTNAGVLTLVNTAVTGGTYGNASAVPSFTVDAKGRLTSAGSSAYQDATAVGKGIVQVGSNLQVASGVISLQNASATLTGALTSTDWTAFNSKQSAALTNGRIRIGNASNLAAEQTLTGDMTMNNLGVVTLANTVTAGTVGSASTIPSITYDAKGRITSTSSSAYQDATGASKGIVQAGTNISVSSGVISVATANTSTTGVITATDWNIFNNKQAALGYTPLNAASNLSDLNSVATARTNLGLGTAAVLNSGTAANNLVQLDGGARIPASTLPTTALTTSSTFTGDISGTSSTISVNRLKGTAINATAPVAGQALVYDGSEWIPTTGFPQFARSTANQTFSTTTLTNVTSMSFALTAGVVYKYRFNVLYTSAATNTGIRLSLTYPAVTVASAIAQIPVAANGTSSQYQGRIANSGDVVLATGTPSTGDVHYATVQGIIIPSVDGTMQLRAASEQNGTNIIVRAGSLVEFNVVP